jgi:hypothetical protein
MPIDVQMPDGTIISGVPDNVTQSDLLKRYQAYTPPAQNAAVPDELGRYDAAKQGIQTQKEILIPGKNLFFKLFRGIVKCGWNHSGVCGLHHSQGRYAQ